MIYWVAEASSGGADDLAAFNEDFELDPSTGQIRVKSDGSFTFEDLDLDTSTGQITVKSGGSIDYEDRSSYVVDIGVTDSKNSSGFLDASVDDTVTLTINVTDAEEAGTVTVTGTARVGETLSAEVTDPDGAVGAITWVWSRATSATGAFNTISGQTNASYTLEAGDENMYVRATATYTDRRGAGKTANATRGPIQPETARPVLGSNSAPEFTGTTRSRTVAENTASGNVGAAITATDVDGDTLTYSVAEATSGGANDLAAFNEDFELDPSTGQVTVRSGGSIDYEDRHSYVVDIGVTDSKNSSGSPDAAIDDTVTLTITVTDVAEAEVGIAGFDTAGLEVVVLASFDAAGSQALWSASGSRWGSQGALVAGDVALDDGSSVVRVVVPSSDGSLLRLNDNGPLVMRDFFDTGGEGSDLTIWVRTAAGTASFAASDVRTAGSNYVNFNVPASARAILTGISTGDRFVLAVTRPTP